MSKRIKITLLVATLIDCVLAMQVRNVYITINIPLPYILGLIIAAVVYAIWFTYHK